MYFSDMFCYTTAAKWLTAFTPKIFVMMSRAVNLAFIFT